MGKWKDKQGRKINQREQNKVGLLYFFFFEIHTHSSKYLGLEKETNNGSNKRYVQNISSSKKDVNIPEVYL